VFTSSSKVYCEGVIKNVIENEDEPLFDYKLYKNHCTMLPGRKGCVKDLDLLLSGRNLKDIVIVDNRSDNYS
jgi:TFIIF-interacting CTD phosphatase-like protein